MRFFLSPFNLIYGAVIRARLALYRKKILKSHSLKVPTISIGNITVGGTGKTPLVALVARILAETERDARVCVLTRGYGRKNAKQRVVVSDGEKILVSDAAASGDEPLELAGKLRGTAVVIADANRAAAGEWARAKFGITAFVLDDAFQHLKVRRDVDIVCVDATNPFGASQSLLPGGILREPLRNLKRADAVVLTRANLIGENEVANLKSQISNLCPKCQIFVSRNKITRLIRLVEFAAGNQIAADDRQWTTGKFFGFCALGNPENFFEQLRQENFDITGAKFFRDHHFYTQKDIDELEKEARSKGANALLTTAKDAVKLKDLNFTQPCLVAESEMVFDDEEGFRRLITNYELR